jgi:isopenicillin N synthase-like dioxygenase
MNIRKINLESSDAGKQIVESLRETGFVVINSQELPKFLIQEVYNEWKPFFASDSEKNANLHDPKTQAGYFPFRSENAKGYSAKDLKEFYHLFYPFASVPNRDYDKYIATNTIAHVLLSIGTQILTLIDKNLPGSVYGNLSQDLGLMAQESNGTLFRILHYPPLTGDHEPGAVRAAAHEDINLITLLPSASAPGLEVQDLEGNWHAVQSEPGDIVINAGDMLQEATGGYLKSTTHRVVNPTDGSEKGSRYSMPLFVHPRSDVRLSKRYTAGEYLEERLREIGLIK